MSNPKASVIHLPPLGRLSQWTSVSPPPSDWLGYMLEQIQQLENNLHDNQCLIELQPYPSLGALIQIRCDTAIIQTICDELYHIRYPSQLTSWVDTARTLSDSVGNNIEVFIGHLTELNALLSETLVWKKTLTRARSSLRKVIEQTDTLRKHIASLKKELEQIQRPSHPQAALLQFNR